MAHRPLRTKSKIRFNILLILGFFITSGIAINLIPSLAYAQSSTGTAADQQTVARYEALRGLLAVRYSSDSNVTICSGTAHTPTKIPLESEITSAQYKDSSFSPIGKGDVPPSAKNGRFSRAYESFVVPATLFGNQQTITCGKALSLYYQSKYSGSDVARRQAFLRDYYDTTGTQPYERKNGAETKLFNDVHSYMVGLISGNSDSFLIWRDRIISQAFNTCWKWNNSANPQKNATDADLVNKDNWTKDKGGNKSVGYMAEVAMENRYDDGVVNCDTVMSYVFKNGNHYLIDYSTDALQNDLNDQTTQYKLEQERAVLATKNGDYVKYCVAGSSAEATFMKLPLSEQINSIAAGLVNNSDTFTYGSKNRLSVNQLSTAYIKKCLKESDIGEKLDAIANISAPSADRTDTGDNGDLGDGCDVKLNNPLTWILCPVIQIIEDGIDKFYNAANTALNFTFTGNESTDQLFAAWSSIRNIANILFVIAFLFIIISQTMAGKL